jgi:branched-chain amino acid transport system permease protein
MDVVAYRPLRSAPRISALITAIAISLALQIVVQLIFGSGQVKFPTIVPNEVLFKVGRKSVKLLEILTMAISILLMLALQFFVRKTRTGKAMRAVSEDVGAAQLMGINVNRTISITFALGCALAAIGAIFYAQKVTYIKPLLGSLPGLKAFVAAVLGGIGSLSGAVLGGFIMGVAEMLFAGLLPKEVAVYRDALVFVILILVLLVRPNGLMGARSGRRS